MHDGNLLRLEVEIQRLRTRLRVVECNGECVEHRPRQFGGIPIDGVAYLHGSFAPCHGLLVLACLAVQLGHPNGDQAPVLLHSTRLQELDGVGNCLPVLLHSSIPIHYLNHLDVFIILREILLFLHLLVDVGISTYELLRLEYLYTSVLQPFLLIWREEYLYATTYITTVPVTQHLHHIPYVRPLYIWLEC